MSIRQKLILEIFLLNRGSYITSGELALKLGCSSKTVQNEIKNLRNMIENNGAIIQSTTGKGFMLKITDEPMLKKFYSTQSTKIDDRETRIKKIISFFLSRNDFVTLTRLSDLFHISESQLKVDMNVIKEKLSDYDLIVTSKYNQGLKVDGEESQVRKCIIGMQLFQHDRLDFHDPKFIHEIGQVILKTLTKHQCVLPDLVLQNVILHTALAVRRNMDGFRFTSGNQIENIKSREYQIANEVYDQFSEKYHFEKIDEEVLYLAINLQGKRLYKENLIISKEIDELVSLILKEIKNKMDLDFSNDMDLRFSLSLHIIPLLYRMENNIQLKNFMLFEIKRTFLLAYDISIIAADVLLGEMKTKLTEDEISYLAIHFNLALEKKIDDRVGKKLLIVSSSRKSEMLMFKYQIMNRFSDRISAIDIVNDHELEDYDLKSYDLHYSISLYDFTDRFEFKKINYFLSDVDYQIIEEDLLKSNGNENISKIFKPELFFVESNISNKADALTFMCKKIEEHTESHSSIIESVLNREMLGFTSFGNLLAFPHTDGFIVDETLGAVLILEEPIDWGDNNKVKLLLMLCGSASQKRELSIFYEIISKFISDAHAINEVIKEMKYESFIEILNQLSEERK